MTAPWSRGPAKKNQARAINQSLGNYDIRLLDKLYVYDKIKCSFAFEYYFDTLANVLTLLQSITQRPKMGITSEKKTKNLY